MSSNHRHFICPFLLLKVSHEQEFLFWDINQDVMIPTLHFWKILWIVFVDSLLMIFDAEKDLNAIPWFSDNFLKLLRSICILNDSLLSRFIEIFKALSIILLIYYDILIFCRPRDTCVVWHSPRALCNK